jgi:DNA-binding beta-propeller fold protein YncE
VIRRGRAKLAASMAGLMIALALPTSGTAVPPAEALLKREATVVLPHTSGRIDHLAVDRTRGRLFVAEIGNGSVDVVDLEGSRIIHRISGLAEPQGVAFAAASDKLVVASGGDGTVRIYDGKDFVPRGVVKLDDADNVRLDPANGHAVVGHGSGGLAIIDPVTSAWLADIPLPAHPEGFAIAGRRAYVNVPEAGEIDVIDLDAARIVATWKPLSLSANFPLTLDDRAHAAVVFRGQAKLALFDLQSGRMLTTIPTCGDADDAYFDAVQKRFMVSCGEGVVDVIAEDGTALKDMGRVKTSWGARTSLFVPEWRRLFVAERAGLIGSRGAISIFAVPEK